jgi:hypothetical protein
MSNAIALAKGKLNAAILMALALDHCWDAQRSVHQRREATEGAWLDNA